MGCLEFSGGAIEGHDAEPIGIEADAEQLGVNVGAFEFGGDGAEVAGGAGDAVAQGGGAARIGGTRQQAFQEIAEGVEAVHDLGALGMAGEEIGVGAQGGFEDALVGFEEAGVVAVASWRSHQAMADFNW